MPLLHIDLYGQKQKFNKKLINTNNTYNLMEVNGNWNFLVTNILQNILFHVPHKRESHTGLERHEDKKIYDNTLILDDPSIGWINGSFCE